MDLKQSSIDLKISYQHIFFRFQLRFFLPPLGSRDISIILPPSLPPFFAHKVFKLQTEFTFLENSSSLFQTPQPSFPPLALYTSSAQEGGKNTVKQSPVPDFHSVDDFHHGFPLNKLREEKGAGMKEKGPLFCSSTYNKRPLSNLHYERKDGGDRVRSRGKLIVFTLTSRMLVERKGSFPTDPS